MSNNFFEEVQTLPQNPESEKTVLASLIYDNSLIPNAVSLLTAEDFYSTINQGLFQAIAEMHKKGLAIDICTLASHGIDSGYLAELSDNETTVNLKHHAGLIRELAVRRKAINTTTVVLKKLYDRDMPFIEAVNGLEDAIKLPDADKSMVHTFSWSDSATETIPLVKFQNTGILWPEGIALLTGPSGKGKSNIMLAAAASIIKPECDTLGFSIQVPAVLYVDTENPSVIFTKNVRRCLVSRVGLIEGATHNGVDFVNIRGIETFQDRQNWLFGLMQEKKYGLYLIDGAGDFVLDVNDAETCVSFVSRLCAETTRNQCGIFVSLHGNPLNNLEKARGVLGSELLRKVDSSLLLKVNGDNRSITTEFSLGKNRGAGDKLTQFFEWSPFSEMHVSCQPPAEAKGKTVCMHEKVLELAQGRPEWSYMELCDAIAETTKKSVSTAEKEIRALTRLNKIIKNDTGTYSVVPEESLNSMSFIHE